MFKILRVQTLLIFIYLNILQAECLNCSGSVLIKSSKAQEFLNMFLAVNSIPLNGEIIKNQKESSSNGESRGH